MLQREIQLVITKLKDLIYAKTGIATDLTGLADDPEAQALVASLMALVAKSDGGISAHETARMVQMLQDRFHLASVAAVDLIDRATNDFGSETDLDGLIENINDELNLVQKEMLLSMVLHVISADDRKDAAEMNLLATLIERLNIPDNIMERAYATYFQDKKEQG